MKLAGDYFAQLRATAQKMGAHEIEFNLNLGLDALAPVDVALAEGVQVALEDIDYVDGLLSYEGRQVLLYIQDQGRDIAKVLEDGSKGRKYHVAHCQTLREMRERNRFERYVVTNDLSLDFYVYGTDWETSAELEGTARLQVCKNCLSYLCYQGYGVSGARNAIFSSFDLEEFFSTYSSFFPHMPAQFAGPNAKDNYTRDWSVIAGKYKAERGYSCENCGLDLGERRDLLHVHHRNGVKRNNNTSNLVALCVECHRMQPCHGHMFVSQDARRIINGLRRRQRGLAARTWAQVRKLCDPGVYAASIACERQRLPVPEVAYLLSEPGASRAVELEIAWPNSRVAIAIHSADRAIAVASGWRAWGPIEVLEQLPQLQSAVMTPAMVGPRRR